MSNNNTLTSANAVLILSQSSVFPVAQQIQGFAADKAWSVEAYEIAETRMGVDGVLSAGYTPSPKKMTISIEPTSDSKAFFDVIIETSKQLSEVLPLTGILTIPGLNETYTLIKGILSPIKQFPDGQKTLQPMDYVITWQEIIRSTT